MLDHTVVCVAVLTLLAEPLRLLRGAALPTAATSSAEPVSAAICQVLPRPHMRLRLSIVDDGDRLSADTISQFAAQTWHAEGLSFEWRPPDTPPSWTNLDAWVQILKVADSRQVLERALGYAVAHELGHYLLASKNHSGTGLMRAALDPSADLAPRSKGATLDPKSRDRLRQRLDMASQCPAVPGVLQKP